MRRRRRLVCLAFGWHDLGSLGLATHRLLCRALWNLEKTLDQRMFCAVLAAFILIYDSYAFWLVLVYLHFICRIGELLEAYF